MKTKLLYLLIFTFTISTYAQLSFIEKNTPFKAMSSGEIKFADVDNDSDLDVLITGNHEDTNNATSTSIAELYLNDGMGNFTLDTSNSFQKMYNTAISFFDFDGDNDLDLLMLGQPDTGQPVSRLYSNNGSGNFTLVTNTPIIGVASGTVITADLDGDNDLDIFLSGYKDVNDGRQSKVYFNDGSGNFVESTNNPFIPVSGASSDAADIDNDNDLDIILSGYDFSNNAYITKLYINNGQGFFSLDSTSSFDGFNNGDIRFEDLDNDGDKDIAIVGGTSAFNIPIQSKLYINTGNGSFTEQNATYDSLILSDFDFEDVDNDNDLDLIIIGMNSTSQTISNLYLNDGSANFTLQSSVNFLTVHKGDVAFADVNNDNKKDILLSGKNISNNGSLDFIKLYMNQSTLSLQNNASSRISIFPNPANTLINIKLRPNPAIKKIVIYNILGEKVLEKNRIEKSEISIDISSLNKGVYLLKTIAEKQTISKKLIVN
ncbi:T9SS type A sorting domain-containing protein [Polaribacter batillariae]|uniref:T9SS type A sorting domain-containing protein n=1 Tax=Polaribacter batillariae TaxID=2808900 RepID=A0ABX7SQQ2_9FLAO|nr:T9SS type A sorting domain-containing protein [Polaribacter batillariae]QTD36562.1 T9SS type A sorting domain-containing protein [Polaribacter batillariae]